MEVRNGSHNARNIYIKGPNRDTDIHAGVMFEPEFAKVVVDALNEYFNKLKTKEPVHGSTYVYLTDSTASVAHTDTSGGQFNVDYSEDGDLLGIEILNAIRITVDGEVVYRATAPSTKS